MVDITQGRGFHYAAGRADQHLYPHRIRVSNIQFATQKGAKRLDAVPAPP